MKVSFITPHFYPAFVYGGPIISNWNTLTEYAKLGFEVYVSTTNANGKSKLEKDARTWQEIHKGIFVKYYNDTILNRLSVSKTLGTWFDIRDKDLVHIQYLFNLSTPITLLYCFLQNKAVVLSPRGSLASFILENGIRFKKSWLRLLIRPFYKRIYWHATSDQEHDEIQLHFPGARVFQIPNGIAPEAFAEIEKLSKQAYLERYLPGGLSGEIPTSGPILISMGRLYRKKGFDILIKAFKEVLNTHPGAVLLIAGNDDGEGANLRQLVEDLELGQQVFFAGHITGRAKTDFLGNADLFVLPSHNENFGNVYLESLAAGTPVIASTNTPWQEVETFDCGRWIDNDEATVAGAILELLNEDLSPMNKAAKAFARRYSWEAVARSFVKEYQNILKK